MSSEVEVTWRVSKMEWDEATGGVLSVRWDICVSDGTTTVASPGTTRFDPNPSSESFVSLKELDEDTVLSWVKSKTYNLDSLEKRAVERYERERKISSVASGIPWESSN